MAIHFLWMELWTFWFDAAKADSYKIAAYLCSKNFIRLLLQVVCNFSDFISFKPRTILAHVKIINKMQFQSNFHRSVHFTPEICSAGDFPSYIIVVTITKVQYTSRQLIIYKSKVNILVACAHSLLPYAF